MQTPVYPDLKQHVVLVTGGASGIGAALVRAFVAQDAEVFFCDVQEAAGRQLATTLGERAHFDRVDLTEEAEVTTWVNGIVDRYGKIQVLINNAARDTRLSIAETSMEDWGALMDLNLRSVFLCTRLAAPHMKGRGASVINFGSVTFQIGAAGMPAYVAAKGGIVALTRAMARELGPDNIRVNTISPGWVMTEKQLDRYVDDDVKAQLYAEQCIPTLIEPAEIAEVALFLASNASRAITGQNIPVNRGWALL